MDWACALILPAKLKSLRNFSIVCLETSRQPGEENRDIQLGLIWFLRDQFLMNVGDSSWLVSAIWFSSSGDQKLGVSKLTKWNGRILPVIHNFQGLNGYRASWRERKRVVVVVGRWWIIMLPQASSCLSYLEFPMDPGQFCPGSVSN